ncbi:MAG TPA: hypothetical protein PLC89_05890 [Haliscomenobacter sp.]|uniref:hypothetical protein n=1 Tax=Haliscomenobacter sp. TaxID=2717303 RepID=UPI002D194DA0|nr:hypothetical protein [Haliscomenobacter sp.]HOY16798.1 hypothetical protein [Haliscomenobacter sp.]
MTTPLAKPILVFTLFLQSILVFAQNNSILGRWHHSAAPEFFIQVDSLGYFTFNPEMDLFSGETYKYTIYKDGGYYDGIEVDRLFRGRIQLEHNFMVYYSFQDREGIEDRIDEVSLFYKVGAKPEDLDFSQEPKTIITLPAGFGGKFCIAYHQPDGKPFEIDAQGNTHLQVDESGYLGTTLPVDPFRMAKGNEVLRYKNATQNLLVLDSNHAEKVDLSIPPQTICVYFQGFNKQGRQMLSQKLGKAIKGNVGYYVVDTYENLLKQ